MSGFPEGNAIVHCEGAFDTANGKTAHGLVRRTRRYRVVSVVDSGLAGQDAGYLLDGRDNGIPILGGLDEAISRARARNLPASHLVVGIAPDGGRMDSELRQAIAGAIDRGLHVDCGLHDFLNDDEELVALARERGVVLRDIRQGPPRRDLHFFTGAINKVKSLRIALLGTDSAVGKRTTGWMLVEELLEAGYNAELIGTGQTSWLQGVEHGLVLDSLVNDFVAGEIEHAICQAWRDNCPDIMVLEGQGSLMNPAYPGGHELLAAGRPHMIIMQHAPSRMDYDGFPGCALHPLAQQIQVAELLSGRRVAAVTINHEGIEPGTLDEVCRNLSHTHRRPCVDPFYHGLEEIVELIHGVLTRSTGGF